MRTFVTLVILSIILNNYCFSIGYEEQSVEKEAEHFVTVPITKRGQKWRIGYIESGPRDTYYASLVATVESLIKLGWLSDNPIPPSKDGKRTDQLWLWLATKIDSQYIEFVKEAYWSKIAEPTEKAQVKAELLAYQRKKGLDLIIAMGTPAGLLIREMSDNATEPYTIPTIIGSTTDAVGAGIVKSAENSGYDHLLAKVDPDRFITQLQLFYSIFRFKKLGVVYDPEKPSTAGFSDVEKVAKDKGFALVTCHAKDGAKDEITLSEQELINCYEQLTPKIDAMYVTGLSGLTLNSLPDLIAPLNQYRVPSFVQLGTQFVEHGMLMTVSTLGYGYLGDFYAETIAKVFNGAKLGELTQILPSKFTFTINLKTAKELGISLPIEAIGAADELYGIAEDDF